MRRVNQQRLIELIEIDEFYRPYMDQYNARQKHWKDNWKYMWSIIKT